MKSTPSKFIKSYYWTAVLVNLIPMLVMLTQLPKLHTEATLLGSLFAIGWLLICAVVYLIYFAIPDLNKIGRRWLASFCHL